MSLYKGMDAEALEAEYNLIKRREADASLEDFPLVVERWIKRSANHREVSGARIDIAYGTGEREKLDYFYSGDGSSEDKGPLLIYIHGGYWQRGDKSMYSFVTEAFIKHGISVAVINYNLTPSVRMGQIPPQIRKALAWCFHNADDLKFDREQIHVTGHSAGGHLAAMMMATDWPLFNNRLPVDLVKTGIPISGVFELEPIVHTSLNEGPQMDIEEALAESPTFIPIATNAPQLVVYGGGESAAFHRQSKDYADKFRTEDRQMELYEVPVEDHFGELERLAEDDSEFFEKTHKLITTQAL